MAGRKTADVVFCIDASASMQPCFAAVRAHLVAFIDGLQSDSQTNWDLRLDFLAHRAGNTRNGSVFEFESISKQGIELVNVLYSQEDSEDAFFTTDAATFRRRIGELTASGDEASLVALDTCLDFPWRDAGNCHRVVIMLTDEPLETGIDVGIQKNRIPQLIEKLHHLRVKLFLVGPSSYAFDEIAAADRSEYQVVDNEQDGLATLDFSKVLEEIGRSVSVASLQTPTTPKIELRALFKQDKWTASSAKVTGR